MGANSNIQWTDHTFNPWIGCTKISPGCDHCYAEAMMDKRLHRVKWGGTPVRTSESYWNQPLKWDADAGKRGVRERVFCASLADVFDVNVPDEWRFDLFNLIEQTPHLDWLLLTKRIGNAKWHLPWPKSLDYPWKNIWIGITVVNQEEVDRDIPKLLATPAAKRFLSVEPMLGPIDLSCVPRPATFTQPIDDISDGIDPLRYQNGPTIDWVIVGGESGRDCRLMDIEWARSIRQQCDTADVAFFMKQLGGHPNKRSDLDDLPADLRVREFPTQ